MSVQLYHEINDSHAATGYRRRTDLPSFHIFTVEDTYPSTRKVMLPYRFDFYQVVLLEDSSDAKLNIKTEAVTDLSDSLSFASPEHVLAWVRGRAQRGYILYFKEEFLTRCETVVQKEFPFFALTEMNLLHVDNAEKDILQERFAHLLNVFQSEHPYRVPLLQTLLLVLLYECKRLHDKQRQIIRQTSPKNALTYRFQQFVNQHYLTRKTVKEYADLLAVSADYLSETIKLVTGKTAHTLIAERIVLEAKRLLSYSDLNITEIADYLGYPEPTHFGRFFRRYVGSAPLAWRQQQ